MYVFNHRQIQVAIIAATVKTKKDYCFGHLGAPQQALISHFLLLNSEGISRERCVFRICWIFCKS